MAQTIVTYCDPCLERGDEKVAHPFAISVQLPGARKPASHEVDLCDECAKSVVDLVAFVEEHGRRAGSAPVLHNPASAQREQPRERPAQPEDDRTCPVCQHVTPTVSGLRTHVKDKHGITLDEATGRATLPCPEDGCDRKFTGPQGVAAHQRSAHGRKVAA